LRASRSDILPLGPNARVIAPSKFTFASQLSSGTLFAAATRAAFGVTHDLEKSKPATKGGPQLSG
jgi:hypothetical protein